MRGVRLIGIDCAPDGLPPTSAGVSEAVSHVIDLWNWDTSRIAVSPYDCAIRSRSQESTPLSAVLAIAVGWLVKPWGESG